jgi:hypothetical protein
LEGQEREGMRLDVPANTTFSKFDLEGIIRCTSSARIVVASYGIKNGNIKFFNDGAEFFTDSRTEEFGREGGDDLSVAVTGDTLVRVEFEPLHSGVDAFAQFFLAVQGVQDFTDNCMTGKLCMEDLSSGVTAFEIANSKLFQYRCLTDAVCVSTWGNCTEFDSLCTSWKTCMTESASQDLQILQAFLSAALEDTTGTVPSTLPGSGTGSDETQCFDPSVSDA